MGMEKLNPERALENNLRLIEHQLVKIEEEIQQRRLLSQRILSKLKEKLEVYLTARNDPTALLNHSPGEGFLKDREHVNQLIRETRHQIAVEEVACWNDIQRLLWEKRRLEREKAQLELNLKLLRGDQNG